MDQKNEKKKSILMRAYGIYFLVWIAAIAIMAKTFSLQFVNDDYWKSQATTESTRKEIIEPTRGNIYAENGELMATSIPLFQVNLDLDSTAIHDTVFNKHVDSLGICLSMFFDKTPNYKYKYVNELKKARMKYNRNFLLVRKASYAELQQIKKFPLLRRGKYGGLVITKKEKRIRPIKNCAAMTIGYERLAEYIVGINLKAGKVNRQRFDQYVDTLADCFYSTFNDYNKSYYLKILKDNYEKPVSSAGITKRMNVLQLAEIKRFPLIAEDTNRILNIQKLTQSYFVGLEGRYKEELRGTRGAVYMKRVGSNSWKQISEEAVVEPQSGCDLYTAIDVNLQDVAQSALRKSMDTTHADWGCVVLMEVKTGYIKAIANLTKDKEGNFKEMRNYAVEELYEPGSTMKLASVIAVLEDGKYDTNQIVRSGRIRYPDYKKEVVDSHEEGYGNISMAKAFEKSSNVGITQITRMAFLSKEKIKKFEEYLRKMGLKDRSGIDLDKEPPPYLPIKYEDLTAAAFGYSIKLTPLQVLGLYNAVANNGKYMKPQLVKEIRRKGVVVKKNEPVVLIDQICSEATLKKVRALLEGVVTRGTARNIRKAPYKVAGKTGTARIWDEATRGYIDRYIASFCGYFPADDPKYSCIVVEYKMQGGEVYGSQVAAPVFKEIADKVFATRVDIKSRELKMPDTLSAPLLDIAFRQDVEDVYTGLNVNLIFKGGASDWVSTTPSDDYKRIYVNDMNVKGSKIPDVKGMTAKDAVYLLEKAGMDVVVKGAGWVKEQRNNMENKTVELILSI